MAGQKDCIKGTVMDRKKDKLEMHTNVDMSHQNSIVFKRLISLISREIIKIAIIILVMLVVSVNSP